MIQAFQPGAKPPPAVKPSSSSGATSLARPLRCATCGNDITSDEARSEIAGAHGHRFTNPAGFTYDLVCFREAPGCYVQGDPTSEFSWFPGFAWCFALCGSCHQHLGWYYQGPSKFFGLIVQRLS